MKRHLTYLWKGLIIGIGIVAPGASGGVFATVLGLYEVLINAGKQIFSHPFKIIKELWSLFIGMAIGAVFAFYAVLTIIKFAPIPMTTLIVGFVIGSIPKIYRISQNYKKSLFDIFLIIFSIAIIAILPFLSTHDAIVVMGIKAIVILFAVGFILGSILVIPGLSGSMVLMVLGFYFFLYEAIADSIKAFLNFDFNVFFTKVVYLLPFAIGLVLGLFTLSKLMAKLLTRHRARVYWVILGLIITSPFSIIFTMVKEFNDTMDFSNIITIIVSIFTLLLGIMFSYKMNKIEDY